MSHREDRAHLKEQFKNGDKPSQEDFADLIDSSLNQVSDQIFAEDQKIGIGTKEPRVPLEIMGGSENKGRQSFIASDGEYSTFRIAHPNNGVVAIGSHKKEVFQLGKFKSEGAEFYPRMTINSEGNIGVGTEDPKEKLDVEGSLKIKDSLFLGGAELVFKEGKLFMYTDGVGYKIKMERVGPFPTPIRPISMFLAILIAISLLLLILIFICIYFELLPT